MLLKDILDELVNNELGNIPDGKPQWATGTFNYKRLIQCVSLGYVELHKRFSLKKESLLIHPQEGITVYVLDPKYAVSNTASSEDKYIMDSAENPFTGNLAKIDSIYDVEGEEVAFETTKFGDEIFLKNYRTLIIPKPSVFPELNLMYRAIPSPIVLQNEGELATYEVDLPYTYLQPLILFAAGRAYTNRGAENDTNNESAIYFANFEQACMQIVASGLTDTENSVNEKAIIRGFP